MSPVQFQGFRLIQHKLSLLQNHEQELLVQKRWTPQGRLLDVQQRRVESCLPGVVTLCTGVCKKWNIKVREQVFGSACSYCNKMPLFLPCSMTVTLSSMAGSLCGLQKPQSQMSSACACRLTATWLCTTRMTNPSGTQTRPNPQATCVVSIWQMTANWCYTRKVWKFGAPNEGMLLKIHSAPWVNIKLARCVIGDH